MSLWIKHCVEKADDDEGKVWADGWPFPYFVLHTYFFVLFIAHVSC